MREVTQNKASTSSATKYLCPSCGQTARHGCRDTLNGPYCVQHGLLFDYGRLLHPSPDPIALKVAEDPQVHASALLETEAQNVFDEACAAWEAALGKLATLRLEASRDAGEFNSTAGGWRPSRKLRDLSKQEPKLSADVERLAEERDLLGRALVRARIAARDAIDAARLRAGGGVQRVNRPARGATIIPT